MMTRPRINADERGSFRSARALILLWMLIAAPSVGAGERIVVDIWHSQSMEKRKAFREIVDAFNDSRGDIFVKEIYIGPYKQLYQKLAPAIRAGRTPALAVAYESMVSSFARAGVVAAFDDYLYDPKIGLSKESREDIFPIFLETNRYPRFGNRMLSFPFTKSILMMYYNLDLLRAAGHDRAPETWDEFIEMCRDVKKLGKEGYALSVDPSTVDGMVFSFGGDVISADHKRPLFDRPEALAALKTIETLIGEGLAYRIPHGTYHDREAVVAGRAAFLIRSSTTGPYLARNIRKLGLKTDWDMAVIPHGRGCKPSTVLFGANICMFKTSPEVQRAAWEFVKFFISPEATAKWSMATGYLPVRKSATKLPQMRAFYAKARQNRRALEALQYARREPNVSGWQDVRRSLASAEAAICQGEPAEEVIRKLQREAEAIINPPERKPTDAGFLVGLAIIAVVFIGGGYWLARRDVDTTE